MSWGFACFACSSCAFGEYIIVSCFSASLDSWVASLILALPLQPHSVIITNYSTQPQRIISYSLLLNFNLHEQKAFLKCVLSSLEIRGKVLVFNRRPHCTQYVGCHYVNETIFNGGLVDPRSASDECLMTEGGKKIRFQHFFLLFQACVKDWSPCYEYFIEESGP